MYIIFKMYNPFILNFNSLSFICSFTHLVSGINLPFFECAIVLHLCLYQLWWIQSCSHPQLRFVSISDRRSDLCLHQAQKNTRSYESGSGDESGKQLKINVHLEIKYDVIENIIIKAFINFWPILDAKVRCVASVRLWNFKDGGS